jgi:TldD protein
MKRAELVLIRFLFVLALTSAPVLAQRPSAPVSSNAADAVAGLLGNDDVQHDPLLRAMAEELARSRAQLKLEPMQLPYYVEYSVTDVEQYNADAVYGALRTEQRARTRVLRAVVRIGTRRQDSYYRSGEGVVEVIPLDGDVDALRHQLWLATDQAYKAAAAALAQKQSALKQIETEQTVDDFSEEKAAVAIGPVQHLSIDVQPWRQQLRTISGLYSSDPQLQTWSASAIFMVQTRYFVNSEGTVLRKSTPQYVVSFGGSTQAADGERLELGRTYANASEKELPPAARLRADAEKTLTTLRNLRQAPLADEEYRGPVLFSADAAGDLVNTLLAPNVIGRKPQFGSFVRTLGDYASSYKSRVLPDFLTLVDDPTVHAAAGRTLLGSYDFDDEGVSAQPVTIIDKGTLVNYLVGREPIRDFPHSNGHGRAAPNNGPAPHIANLFLRSAQTQSFDQLKARLLQMCKDQGRPYGYLVSSVASARAPRVLYRVYVSDGRMEVVRGASFDQLDARAMRSSIIAAGDDAEADNQAGNLPSSIVAPSLLFDEVMVKRSNQGREKLPLYPPPDATPAAAK